ncbi:carboxypeptidase-like regulatory domain-containing protein [Flavicella sediminum]|uniref:carboxypeptidase-like regulatory domain-containing protein n=1 Tax=Flavicella sediminum TaxID=2585141 RepID=UPI0011217455|nr:carboxypeptidase-like regulatory domain-containing protein [Flavicella sediminum]
MNLKHVLVVGMLLLFFAPITVHSQTEIDLKGIIYDENNYEVPYAAVYLRTKKTGAYSTEDGEFLLTITKNDFSDIIDISSIGFKKKSISVKEFLALNEKKIILEENVASLDEVEIISADDYALRAIKNLKKSSLRKKHQINALYRVTTTEMGVSKRFIEYYMKIIDMGPSVPNFLRYELAERRQSADYRIDKSEENIGTFENLTNFNIIRNAHEFKQYTWKKIGDTNYGDEDVLILENNKHVKIYVGLNDYGIYRVQKGDMLFIYNRDPNGKMHLTYHKREWNTHKTLKSPNIIAHLKSEGHKNPEKLKISIRYEFIVLDVISDKKKMDKIVDVRTTGSDGIKRYKKKIAIPYRAEFWHNLVMPPETKFFKKIKSELESQFNVPFETQLELVNKK